MKNPFQIRFLFGVALALIMAACTNATVQLEETNLNLGAEAQRALGIYELRIANAPDQPDAYYQSARILLSLGELEKAKERVQRALQLQSQQPKYRLLAGKIEYRNKSYFQAIQYLSAALVLDPNLLEGYYLLGKCFEQSGKNTQALQEYQKALELEPLYFEARLAKIALQVHMEQNTQNFGTLAQELETAMRLKPGSVEGILVLASIYNHQGASLKAKLVMEKWMEEFGEEDQVLLAMAELEYAGGQSLRALEWLKKIQKPTVRSKILVLKSDSRLTREDLLKGVTELAKEYEDQMALWVWLGEMAVESGEYKTAERHFQKALQLEPNNAKSYFELSRIYDMQGDFAGSEWALKKSMELEPTQFDLQLYTITRLLNEGRPFKAKDQLNSYQLDPTNPRVARLYAMIAKEEGDLAGAEEQLLRLAQSSGSMEVEMELADLEIRKGAYAAARNRIARVLKLFPDNQTALVTLSRLNLQLEKPEEVIRLLAPKADTSQGRGRLQLLLAEAYAKTDDLPKALATLQKGLRYWPLDPELVQAYTLYLGLAGRHHEAIPMLEQMQGAKNRYTQLFYFRLAEYYHQAGQRNKFGQTPLNLNAN